MKKTNFFYHVLIVLGMCGFMFCGNDGNNNNNETGSQAYDSTLNNNDSTNAVHQRDPATAYPQPPVTGSSQDSSRTKDSASRPGQH